MEIKYIYSHQNAREWLLVHKPKLWKEIQSTVKKVDADLMKTKKSKEKTMKGEMKYAPKAINKAFKTEFEKKKWKEGRQRYYVTSDTVSTEEIVRLKPSAQLKFLKAKNKNSISTFHQTDFIKEKVAIELQLGKYAFIEYDLFVKHLHFYEKREINIAIEIVPTKAFQRKMSSGPGYYERALTHIIRQGRGRPAFPFILIGIEPKLI